MTPRAKIFKNSLYCLNVKQKLTKQNFQKLKTERKEQFRN